MADIPRFGANDFYLTETDPLIWREKLRASLAEVLGRDVLDSDPHMVLASAFLPFLVQGQASADAAAKATLRAFAVGADLDRIADSTCVVGYLDRAPARSAILACILYATVTRPHYVLDDEVAVVWSASRSVDVEGVSVSFSASGSFSVSFAALEESRRVAFPVYLRSDALGAAYNGLLFAAGPNPIEDSDIQAEVSATADHGADMCSVDSISAYRCGASYGGADIESDASFAERVAWQAKALRVPGSLEYFLLALSELHLTTSTYVAPRVDSEGRIVMAWCDKPHAYALWQSITFDTPGEAYEEFLHAVQACLLVEQRAMAYPARVTTHYFWQCQYYLPAGTADTASASAAVESAWRAYVAEHAWKCGAVLDTNDMAAAVISAGATAVHVVGFDEQGVALGRLALPLDVAVPDYRLSILCKGPVDDDQSASGSDGEEITP